MTFRLTSAEARRYGLHVAREPRQKAVAHTTSTPIPNALWDAHCLPWPEPEYRFATSRRWRLDYAWPDHKVAIEIQGGVFSEGRHVRGGALRKEFEKLSAAAIAGWRILLVLPEQIRSGAVFDLVRQALEYQP